MEGRRLGPALRSIATLVVLFADAALGAALHTEFGVGLSALRFDDYPGSDESHDVLLPFPYIVVHTERLDIERDKVRGRLFHSGDWSADLGFSGALPVDSDANDARAGMPDLAWVGEVGPELRYAATHAATGTKLGVELVSRAAFSIGDPALRYRGWWASPRLSVERAWTDARGCRIKLEGNLGFVYGSRGYNEYYYEVAPAYAAPGRPAYDARSGWGGLRFAFGVGVRRAHLWYGGFVRYRDVSDAEFADSPLVRAPTSLNLGLAVAYVF